MTVTASAPRPPRWSALASCFIPVGDDLMQPGEPVVRNPVPVTEDGGSETTYGYVGPQSVTWRIAREYVMLLGAGRAVLMQLAHPLVAAGVLQHSSFLRDPLGRSYRTVEFTQTLAFGSRDEAHALARHVNRLHQRVVGALGKAAGQYSAETEYRAQDPELLLWVYATLVDSALSVYPLLVGPLQRTEQRQYYEETKRMAILLGLPREQLPASLEDFESYVRAMLAGPALAVTPAARALCRQLLYLPAPAPVRLVQPLGEQLTIGFLPPRLRALYSYTWGGKRQRVFSVLLAIIRHLLPLAPPGVRYTPWARRAMTSARQDQQGNGGPYHILRHVSQLWGRA
jgi:uncharacterized protein (DUF2236 family)